MDGFARYLNPSYRALSIIYIIRQVFQIAREREKRGFFVLYVNSSVDNGWLILTTSGTINMAKMS